MKNNKKEIKTDAVYKLDQFFTKNEIAEECIKEVDFIFPLNEFDFIIEPSAGTGSFVKSLPDKTIAIEIDSDLCKENSNYICQSFLDYQPNLDNKRVLVIGNPPFGTQNKLSVDFFNHAANFAEVIAYCYLMIHPQSYGSKFQERFRREYKFTKVAAKQKSGDMTKNNKNTEYKVSIFDNKNPIINIVQIRPQHNVDNYIVQVVDARNIEKCSLYTTWLLSKEQMKQECDLHGNHAAHGEKGSADELRIDLEFESAEFNKFQKEYLFKGSF